MFVEWEYLRCELRPLSLPHKKNTRTKIITTVAPPTDMPAIAPADRAEPVDRGPGTARTVDVELGGSEAVGLAPSTGKGSPGESSTVAVFAAANCAARFCVEF